MLQLLSFSKKKLTNTLSIYIKTNTGSTLAVDLDPKWDIKNVKEFVAPQLGLLPTEVKIIFAGKELSDNTIVEVKLTHTHTSCFLYNCVCERFLTKTLRNAIWVNRAYCMRSKSAVSRRRQTIISIKPVWMHRSKRRSSPPMTLHRNHCPKLWSIFNWRRANGKISPRIVSVISFLARIMHIRTIDSAACAFCRTSTN